MGQLMNRVVHGAADTAWRLFQAVNTRLPEGKPFQPVWAPAPLLKSYERTMPPLGFPRETDSLCPKCVIEVRKEILDGQRDVSYLTGRHKGEIKAQIVEEDGKILIRKRCPEHGEFWDTLSIDPEFTRVIERRFPGRDYRTMGDEHLHRHGASTIKYGRGAVLTIDLTNRCNMMCNPCFMDANQVGYVHELTLDDVKRLLDASISFKPRRQMSVQFSGGEPTMSPIFLDACRYAKEIGYYRVQAATNGLRFAQDPDYAFAAKEAGLDFAYFQFDGVTNEANSHRHISNLFDAKLLAIENMAAAGLDVTPVTTVLNGVNNDQVGPLLDFVIANSDKMGAISYQPVSFTGRDEFIPDELRHKQRYTMSHLAWDLAEHTNGLIDPHRDWFPIGAGAGLTILADHLRGPDVQMGGLACSCHPNCGASVFLMVNHRTKAWAPLTKFFDMDQFMKDIAVICDSARGKKLTQAQAALSIVRNFNEKEAPAGLDLPMFLTVVDRKFGGSLSGERPGKQEWKLVWVGGMWFQDLWTYDFRRTEMCVIPYATQEGEISFCAYNTGVGWRQIVENMHMTATTAEWYKQHGRHPVYAGDRPMPLPERKITRVFLPVLNAGGNAAARAGEGCATEAAGGSCGCGSSMEAKVRELLAAPVAAGGGGVHAPGAGNGNGNGHHAPAGNGNGNGARVAAGNGNGHHAPAGNGNGNVLVTADGTPGNVPANIAAQGNRASAAQEARLVGNAARVKAPTGKLKIHGKLVARERCAPSTGPRGHD